MRTIGNIVLACALVLFLCAVVGILDDTTQGGDKNRRQDFLMRFWPAVACTIIGAALRIRGRASEPIVVSNWRQFVNVTPSAAAHILDQFKQGRYPADAAIRIARKNSADVPTVFYDFIQDDGWDWVGQSCGVTVIIDKDLAADFGELTVDFVGGQFVFRPSNKPGEQTG